MKNVQKYSSLAQQGVKGYYIGPALESYWCYKVWTQTTNCSRIIDTLDWYPTPTGYAWNNLNGADIVTEAASTLSQAILQPASGPHMPSDQR